MNWTRGGRTVTANGSTTIYVVPNTGWSIESRKRHHPHANGIGTWDYTSFHVLYDGKEVSQEHSLARAKEWAERQEATK